MHYFQDIIEQLTLFWKEKACNILQPIDTHVGAGTFHPATFFGALSKKNVAIAYPQGCRRPDDSRDTITANRLQHYYQFQVVIQPSPENIIDIYLESLAHLGIAIDQNDIRFIEDDWESPTLGAKGFGWEVWLNGMEISQFTYFQRMGGVDCPHVAVELTYGTERIAMHLQNKTSILDLDWSPQLSYGDLFSESEIQRCKVKPTPKRTAILTRRFQEAIEAADDMCDIGLPLVAYEHVLESSHLFNLIDASGALSVRERQAYILKIRTAAQLCAKTHIAERNGK